MVQERAREERMIDLRHGDCLEVLKNIPDNSVHCCVTSPPYWGLRDYGVDGQIGLEATPEEYVSNMIAVFREVNRVLRHDGTLWLNLGDSYASGGCGKGGVKQQTNFGSAMPAKKAPPGLKQKDLAGIPWRVAFALQAYGWWLRSDIIWSKPNPMPESVTDRPTKAHEYVFLLTKSAKYFWDQDAVRDVSAYPVSADRCPSGDYSNGSGRNDGGQHRSGGFVTGASRNIRSVWTIATTPFSGGHFATMPPELAERCIKAGTSENGCCPQCGGPWVRVVDAESVIDPRPMTTGAAKKAAIGEMARTTPPGRTCGYRRSTTLGFRQSCACPPQPPVPCTILDPFSGAGTTAMVADRLGRNAIGIELNPEYVAMSRDRLASDRGPLLDAMMERHQ